MRYKTLLFLIIHSFAYSQITTRSAKSGFTLLTPNGIISQKESQTNDTTNIAIGSSSLSGNSTGKHNVAIGLEAMKYSNGTANIAIGPYSLQYAGAVNGHNNVAIGYNSLNWLTSGRYNTSIGEASLLHSNGSSNAALGAFALHGTIMGNANTAVGYKSGKLESLNSTTPYSGNVFLGHMAGFNSYENNKLYIANSDTDSPLIWGDFNSGLVGFHGKVGIGTKNPQGNLHIYQNAAMASLVLNNSFVGSSSGDGLQLIVGQYGSSIINRENQILYLGTYNTNIATLHPDGKFGIGLNGLPASSDLHIHKNDYVNTELQLTNTSTGYFPTDGFSISMKNGGELEMNYKESQKVVFQTNTSATPELVLHTNGNLGLGVTNASTKLEVNGFTKLGTDAPAIKIKKINTTSPATEGASINLDHLVSPNKIISVQVLLEYISNSYVPPSYDGNGGFWYDWYVSGDKIYIKNKLGSSGSILSKPIKIVITYEE